MQDPNTYFNQLNISVPGAIDTESPAVLDPEYKSYVNWETFFFATTENRQRFEAEPLDYCGLVTDPVTYERFQPTQESPRYDVRGRPFFFASDSSMAVFKTMPDSLFLPVIKMKKKM